MTVHSYWTAQTQSAPPKIFIGVSKYEAVNRCWSARGYRELDDVLGLTVIAGNSLAAVDVPGTKRTSFQVTELVEHEEQMIAGAGIVAVPDAVLVNLRSKSTHQIQINMLIILVESSPWPYQISRYLGNAG
jgi:hypothetical protein